jgi:hypothetical protein
MFGRGWESVTELGQSDHLTAVFARLPASRGGAYTAGRQQRSLATTSDALRREPPASHLGGRRGRMGLCRSAQGRRPFWRLLPRRGRIASWYSRLASTGYLRVGLGRGGE